MGSRRGNNIQMKNNPFRSNAISRRTDGQTELQSCTSAPHSSNKERGEGSMEVESWNRDWRGGMERSLQREGQTMGRSQDIRMIAGDGGLGGGVGFFCSDIASLAPSELDIKSPCQVLPTLKDT